MEVGEDAVMPLKPLTHSSSYQSSLNNLSYWKCLKGTYKNGRLDEPENRSGRCAEEKMFFPYPESNYDSSVVQHMTYFFFLVFWWVETWVYLVRRPLIDLLYKPWMIDDECGAVGGMRIGRGNRSTRRKPTPVPVCPLQIPHDLTSARSWRLSAWAMERPQHMTYLSHVAPGVSWYSGAWNVRDGWASTAIW
jgi:hypothetical protein